jgi:hypothetical protein
LEGFTRRVAEQREQEEERAARVRRIMHEQPNPVVDDPLRDLARSQQRERLASASRPGASVARVEVLVRPAFSRRRAAHVRLTVSSAREPRRSKIQEFTQVLAPTASLGKLRL